MKRLLLFISVCCTFTSLYIGLLYVYFSLYRFVFKKKIYIYIYIIHRYARMCVLMYYIDKENKTRLSLSKLFFESSRHLYHICSLTCSNHSFRKQHHCKQENSAEN